MIVASASDAFVRIALLQNSELVEFFLWDRQAPDGVDNLYTGRVDAIEKALAGSFVTLDDTLTGFLPDSAGGKHLSKGQYICTQIVRAGQNGKGPRLALKTLPPEKKIGLMARGAGPLIELAERFPDDEIVLDNYALMAELRPVLPGRLRYNSQAIDFVLDDEIAALAEPTADLPYGARLLITQAPAATLLDVDSASASAIPALALNMAILPEICRQIRLRNLSGGILLDFAGLKPSQRKKFLEPLRLALAQDPLAPSLLGLSHLGLAEISRRRIYPPLSEILRSKTRRGQD